MFYMILSIHDIINWHPNFPIGHWLNFMLILSIVVTQSYFKPVLLVFWCIESTFSIDNSLTWHTKVNNVLCFLGCTVLKSKPFHIITVKCEETIHWRISRKKTQQLWAQYLPYFSQKEPSHSLVQRGIEPKVSVGI